MTAKRGRPRNQALDKLQADLAVSRRHAARIAKEAKSMSANPAPAKGGLLDLRAQKLLREVEYLETRIRTARLQEREISGELLYFSEAQELATAAHSAVSEALASLGQRIAPRLMHQPQKAIEATLNAEGERIRQLARVAVAKVQGGKKL